MLMRRMCSICTVYKSNPKIEIGYNSLKHKLIVFSILRNHIQTFKSKTKLNSFKISMKMLK